jgi:class 3 adenylate cyclase
VRELGIEVRAGVHTGECELIGDDIGGMAVHIGARVGALVGPGEVLATSTVRDLVAGSGIGFAERGTHELKGVPGQWALLAVSPEAEPKPAPLAPPSLEGLTPAQRASVVVARRAPRLARAIARATVPSVR